MTPKEKAVDLVNRFKNHVNPYTGSGMLSNTHDDSAILWQSKQCALIAVDELIGSYKAYSGMYDQEFFDSERNYWQQVRTEIENL